MGAYYRDVVVVIELGAYIQGVLTFNGCLLSRFYGMVHTFCAGSRKGSVNVSVNDLSHVASSVEAVYMYGERKNWKLAHSNFL